MRVPRPILDMALADGLPAPVAGLDEVGRGPWAGPLVAAAVILPEDAAWPAVDDSKRLSPKRRAALARQILETAAVGIAVIEVAEIDRLGLGPANDAAMARAVAALPKRPAGLIVDGRRVAPGLNLPARGVPGGDGKVAAIAAASIVAKVHRDDLMDTLNQRYPGYGWDTNRGYGTRAHADALDRLGVTPEHRRCFAPIAARIAARLAAKAASAARP